MSKKEIFHIISSTPFSSTTPINTLSNQDKCQDKWAKLADRNTYFLPSVNVLDVFEARFFIKVNKKANNADNVDNVDNVDSNEDIFSLYCQLTAYPEGDELQTSTPISTKIINDLTDSFISTIVAHIRKLCYLDYPCRLFHKVLTLKPEILEEGEKIEILKLQHGGQFDPTDPTFFFVDEKLYAYFTYNFCAYRKYITALLVNDYKKINTIRPSYDDSACTMWEEIATQEREALIIYSMFFDPTAEFFVNPEPEQAKEAFNSFKERISIWLHDALDSQHQLCQEQYQNQADNQHR